MKRLNRFLGKLEPLQARSLFFLLLNYFFILFSYPLIRSSSAAYFYDFYSAKDFPLATLSSVVFLSFAIALSNYLQRFLTVQRLYCILGLAYLFAFASCYIGIELEFKLAALILFALKESYIVLFIHLSLAFANNLFTREQVKKLFAPLGAVGSLGGILGGQLTSWFALSAGTHSIYFAGMGSLGVSAVFFYFTFSKGFTKDEELRSGEAPLILIKKIKGFVITVASIIALTQWIIYVADLQFNILFEQAIPGKDQRTEFLGRLYSYVNMLSVAIQLMIIPFFLAQISNRRIFSSLPLVYGGLILVSLLSTSSLLVGAGTYILLKGVDYSIFSYSKEVLYTGLGEREKYGAKYVIDMFVYRLAKGLIALATTFVLIQNIKILNMLQLLFVMLWIVAVFILFKLKKGLNHESHS